MIKILIYGVTAFFVGMLLSPVFAGGYEPPTVNNFNITAGVSGDDLAKGLTMTAAGASHQFDYATHQWQGSITGSWLIDTSADAISVGIGKRFEFADVLWHGSVTRSGDDDLLVVGGSFRF